MTASSMPTNASNGAKVLSEFFELGQQESISPFLQPDSRNWSINLTLKAALTAALLLILSFAFSFHSQFIPLSKICLSGVYFFSGITTLI
jgi:Cd2+/Zn2+-exporting ATPase